MLTRILVAFMVAAASGLAADWNVGAATAYLDSRQKEWFAWPVANKQGTPCLSCHTGLPYLLARPALRHALSESGPTEYETGLLDSLRSGLKRPPRSSQAEGWKRSSQPCCWRIGTLLPGGLRPRPSRLSTGSGGFR